ncbi:uncharacterized protein LODBEIA_P38400 [Lodderomyces beijingensis]|uniref:Transcription initiation factor TFIID subunit 8 n=1 Tax=Lodderomyces beijingensis TaxID=1775926 RepID=A0ABP0ZRR7_9ASCO
MNLEQNSPARFQLFKVLAILMRSREYHVTEAFLYQLLELASGYIDRLLTRLLECAQLQRRRKPSLSDMQMLFKLMGISVGDLIPEIDVCKHFPRRKEIEETSRSERRGEESEDDSASAFGSESYSISEVVPNLRDKPSYIPSYLPDLPPDYTYHSTATYRQPLTDLKQLRIKLVEESRLAEKSLYRLIEDDEREQSSRSVFEKEIRELEEEKETNEHESEMNPASANEVTINATVEAPEQNVPFTFDFEKYAKKRKEIRLKKEGKQQETKALKESNVFLKAESIYGPYATKGPTKETDLFFKNVLDSEFRNVIASLRSDDKKRKQREAEALKQREMEENERRKMSEIRFNFGQERLRNGYSSDMDDNDNDSIDLDVEMKEAE